MEDKKILEIASQMNEDKGCFLLTEVLKIYTKTENDEIKLRIIEDLCKYDAFYEHQN